MSEQCLIAESLFRACVIISIHRRDKQEDAMQIFKGETERWLIDIPQPEIAKISSHTLQAHATADSCYCGLLLLRTL
jgi:hypothetical protein